MSRSAVRSAIKTWFAPPTVKNLNAVFLGTPYKITADDYFGGAASGSGAAAFVFIGRDYERRTAIGGAHSGQKFITYECQLVTSFRSTQDSDTATTDYDQIVDDMKARLRADRTLGSATIFQAGEGNLGQAIDIDARHQLPQIEGNVMRAQFSLIFNVLEVLTNT